MSLTKCLLLPKHVDRLMKIPSPISRFIRDVFEVYIKFSSDFGYSGCALHDPLTLATLIAPEFLTMKEYFVDVDISGGVSMGKTFADILNVTKKPANMRVAMNVRGDDFIELFLQRMESAKPHDPGLTCQNESSLTPTPASMMPAPSCWHLLPRNFHWKV